jgi:hypothetical protein
MNQAFHPGCVTDDYFFLPAFFLAFFFAAILLTPDQLLFIGSFSGKTVCHPRWNIRVVSIAAASGNLFSKTFSKKISA